MYTLPPTASCSFGLPLPLSFPSSPTSAPLSDDVKRRPARLWFRVQRRPFDNIPSLSLETLAAGHRAGETIPSSRDPRPPAHPPPLTASHLPLPWRSCRQKESEASGHGSTSTRLPPSSRRRMLSRSEMAGRGGPGGRRECKDPGSRQPPERDKAVGLLLEGPLIGFGCHKGTGFKGSGDDSHADWVAAGRTPASRPAA
jgi:hypothetical protein